jgi:glycosyltransferase involved in cell wall biosynthesis
MKFSVIIPSYNQGQFIQRTIDSVRSQDGVDFEIAVFDGGSTDDTVAVLKSYGDALQFVSEADDGQTDAVNKGILATDGDVIAWINSDDIYYPGAFKSVARIFDERPEVDVIYGRGIHIDLKDEFIEDYPTAPWNMARMRNQCLFCQPATFFRRSVVEKFGLLDKSLSYCMDYEYWLRIAKGGANIYFLDRILAGSRLYAENKTLSARRKVHAEINDMQRNLFGDVPQRWLLNYAHVASDETISRQREPVAYAYRLMQETWHAGRRWNSRIEWLALTRCSAWLLAAMSKQLSGNTKNENRV